MMRRSILPILALAGFGLLAGCDLAPDYQRPSSAEASSYGEDPGWKGATPLDEQSKGAWWTLFGDETLNQLQDRVGSANQTLQAAVAHYAQARAATRIARADEYPQVTGGGDAMRQRRSQTVSNPTKPFVYDDGLAEVGFSWEIDLWGRVRNEVAASRDLAQASAADLAGVELGLRAELASDYFALRGNEASQALLDGIVASYEHALTLTTNRYKGGVAAAADVAQAQTQLESARTQAADIRLKRSQLLHAIAIMVGQPPSNFALPEKPLATTPPAIAPGLPSTLLERRPDVAAAERRVAAANAGIGVARAGYFPVFDLRALVGLESATAGQWLTAPSNIWGVGPALAGPLFDGGRVSGQSEQARAAYGEAVATYRQTVLGAYRDVEDELAAMRQLEQEATSQDAAVIAAQKALDQANLRYNGGLTTYLEVVVSQNALLTAQLSASDIHTRRMTDSVQLVKALGGGWTAQGVDGHDGS